MTPKMPLKGADGTSSYWCYSGENAGKFIPNIILGHLYFWAWHVSTQVFFGREM